MSKLGRRLIASAKEAREQVQRGAAFAVKKKRRARSAAKLSTLDDFLTKEGKREEFAAVAIKEVLAWQIGEAMKAQNLSRKRLAERMHTSRSQVSRLLDPKDGRSEEN